MVKLYATNISYASGTNTDPYSGGHHKSWTGLDDLKNANGIAYCQHPDFQSTIPLASTEGLDNYKSCLIPGYNGSLHTPAPLQFKGFNTSSLSSATAIKSVVVHYKQQTFENEGDVIDMGGATVTILGANVSKTGSEKVTTELKEQKITFTEITKAQLLSNDFGVKIAYPKNGSARKCGRIIIQDVYVEVLTGEPTIKYPQKVEITSGYTCGSTDQRYKCWDNLENLKSKDGTAYCRNPDTADSPLIAGKNGTYKQPAPLTLSNFGYSLPSSAIVEKVVFHYKTQKFINGGYYPDIGGATITLLGTNASSKTGKAVSSTKTEDTVTFTGVTLAQVNSSSFGVKVAFPANTSTTPGRIILEDTYLEVYTNLDGVKLSLSSSFSNNPVTEGDTFDATFTVKKTSSDAYNSKTVIDLPLGVDIVSQTTSVGSTTVSTVNFESYTFKRITWTHTLVSGTTSNTIRYSLKAVHGNNYYTVSNSSRIKQCIMQDTDTQIKYTNYLTINSISVTLSCTLSGVKTELVGERTNKYTATVKTDDPTKCDKVLWVNLSDGGTLVLDGISFTGYDSHGLGSNGNYWIKFKDTSGKGTFNIPINIWYDESGAYTCKMWVTPSGDSKHLSDVLSMPFLVRDKDLGLLAFTRILIPEEYTQNMGHGIKYTLGSMIKYVLTGNYNVADHGNNLRIGVFNSGADYVSDETDFTEHVVWCNNMATATSKEATVAFTYNENNPLYFVYSHEFVGDPLNPMIVFNFSEPFLVETSLYSKVNERGLMITPAPALLGDTKYATGTFSPSISSAIPIDVWKWEDGGIFDEDISPLGVEILFNYIVSDKVWINVELYLDSTHYGSRDIILEKGSGTGHAGNSYDLFGLKPADFKEKLANLELRFTVINQASNSAKVQLNNVVARIKYVHRVTCGYGLSIDGEHTHDYGIIVKNVDHNFGTKNEKSTYRVTGTDDTIINRLNVESKKISILILIPDCKLKDNIYLIDRVVEMFTNNRELNSNKPIPKHLIFDQMPDREFLVVRVDEFDDEIIGNSYQAKITLEVPDGTTYDVEKTVTGARGSSPSTIAIKPEIYYKSSTAGKLTIHETMLDQTLIIDDKSIMNGSSIVIDAKNRTVLVDGETDVTKSIDFNSNWFRLKGEYEFTSDTGTIQSVEYYIRR